MRPFFDRRDVRIGGNAACAIVENMTLFEQMREPVMLYVVDDILCFEPPCPLSIGYPRL